MDTSHLLYQAAATSLDSWDLENLRYLRKISSGYRASASANANAKLSSNAEESYSDSASYQSIAKAKANASGKKTPASGRSSRLEIATTIASVHNSSSCDGDEEDDSLLLPLNKQNGSKFSEAQAHNESDEETINEIEEFSSFCGNIRSIPVPDAKINGGMQATAAGCGRAGEKDDGEGFDELEEPRSLSSRPLDTCYQLDVLTIRNESVLATKNQAMVTRLSSGSPCKIPKAMIMAKHCAESKNGSKKQLRNGSDGFSSSGESSGMDEGIMYGDGRCLHAGGPPMPAHVRSPRKKNSVSQRLSSSSSPSSSSSSAYSSSSIPSTLLENERTGVCPFCDGVGSRLPSTNSRTYYYMGENENGSTTREHERTTFSPGTKAPSPSRSSSGTSGVGVDSADVDADTTDTGSELLPCSSNGADKEAAAPHNDEGDGDTPPPLPRTPSPYYVRLRRDLITSYSPALCPPRNFGMDKQGQLVIDYSQNWIGLEKYIEKLRLNPVES